VSLLSIVGLATGAFFFVCRDLFATAIFHNFLGTFGVAQALKAADRLLTLEQIQPALIETATVTVVVLALGYWWLRRDQTTDAPAATQAAPAG
jgi:hypothetical protein